MFSLWDMSLPVSTLIQAKRHSSDFIPGRRIGEVVLAMAGREAEAWRYVFEKQICQWQMDFSSSEYMYFFEFWLNINA